MKCSKNIMRKRSIVTLIFILLVFLIGYLFLSAYDAYTMTSHDYRAEVVDEMGQRINLLFLEINDFPKDEGDDILYLGRSNDLRRFINSNEDIGLRKDVEEDFLSFIDVNKVYYQLRYIDENGYEVIRAEFDGENSFIADNSGLQYKGDRYYFNEAMTLEEGEIYVSKLDLNIENGVLENRGTIEKPEYVPIIRYALPVFNDFGKKKGIVVLNVYADYFLEDIRRLAGDGEVSFLIDNDGYYLAHPNRSKEFSFMFDSSDNLISDYGKNSEVILDGFDLRTYEDDKHVFTFRYLYPTIGTFEMHQGSEKVFGKDPENEYYWVLVSVSEKDLLDRNIRAIKSEFTVFVLFSSLIIILILILLLIILVMNGDSRK